MSPNTEDKKWMQAALALAEQAASEDEVPVGAVLVSNGELVASAYNSPISSCDPTAHAEIKVLRLGAENLGNYRLPDCTLYVTIEPCSMCAGALVHARIKRLVFGALETKSGAVVSNAQLLDAPYINHKVEYLSGVYEDQCRSAMQAFFADKRSKS
ncbi:MAG TPA: tRNA adenosine(34) deaminase TadA [Pseudomonadales bacterium]